MDLDAEDRMPALGLLVPMLYRGILTTLFFMDIILAELSTLSCLFQDSQANLETSILETKSSMYEFAKFTIKLYFLEEVESKINAMVKKLNAAGLDLILPLRPHRLHNETDYIEGLCTYTLHLGVEINHQFNLQRKSDAMWGKRKETLLNLQKLSLLEKWGRIFDEILI